MDTNSELGLLTKDINDLLNTLLLYKLVAATLKQHEIDSILDEGQKSICVVLSKNIDGYFGKTALEKISADVVTKIKETINSINTQQ